MSLTRVTPTVTSDSLVFLNNTFKNKIINGDMRIDQRYLGASFTPFSDLDNLIDRYKYRASQSSRFSVQRNAGGVIPPIGFDFYLGLTSLGAYTLLNTDYFGVTQRIEGMNVAEWAIGTTSAPVITVSFWVYSSLTGLHSGSLKNAAENRSYVFTFNINSANTWEFKSVTLGLDTTGTWQKTVKTSGLILTFNLGSGANFLTTPGSWVTGNFYGATSSVSVVSTSGATFYVTGIQIERSSTATPFEYREFSFELLRCQRYLYVIQSETSSTKLIGMGYAISTTAIIVNINLPMLMMGSTYSLAFPSTGVSFWDGTTTLVGTGYGSQSGFMNTDEIFTTTFTVSGATANRVYYARFNATNLTFSLQSEMFNT